MKARTPDKKLSEIIFNKKLLWCLGLKVVAVKVVRGGGYILKNRAMGHVDKLDEGMNGCVFD